MTATFRAWATATTVIFVVLAGCSSDPSPHQSAGSGTSSTPPTLGPVTNATLKPLDNPWVATLYFTANKKLSPELPPAGAVPIGTPSAALATGFSPSRFDYDVSPFPIVVGPENVKFIVYVSSAAPQPSNGAFDFAVWFGSPLQYGLSKLATGAPVHAPGTPQKFEYDLPFGTKIPMVIPAGGPMSALVTGQFGGESGEPKLVVGGPTPSRIELTIRNYTHNPHANSVPDTPSSTTGSILTSTGPPCQSIEGSSKKHDLKIHANATLVQVSVSAKAVSAGPADIDLELLQAATSVGSSHSPFGDEGLFLAGDGLVSLRGQTLAIHVLSCGPGPLNYSLKIEQLID